MRIPVLFLTLALLAGCRSMPRGPEEGSVNSVDGVPIHYRVAGSGAPAAVLVHGWACDGSIWDAQVEALGQRRTVVTIDLAGHGRSGRDRASWSMPAFAADVRAVIERLRLERVVLVGHSMSGYVILETARSIPDRVAGLVPVDTLQNAEWHPGETMNEWLESLRKDFVPGTRRFVMDMFPEGADPALVERMATRMSSMPPEIGTAVLRSVFAYDATSGLSEIRVPIRAINSDKYPTRLDVNRRYAPQFDVTIMRGCGHFPMLERPDEFNRLLERTIEDLSRPSS